MSEEGRGLLGGMEKVLLLVVLGIIAYVGFKNGGFDLVERTEEITIVDQPHAPRQQNDTEYYKKREQAKKEQVDAMLRDFARSFSGEQATESQANWRTLDISQDEMDYYQNTPQRYSDLRSSLEKASDWYHFLKTSQKTYTTLKSMFSEMTGKPADGIQVDDISMLLNNDSDANQVYDKIENLFGVSRAEADSFAQSGKKAISDWAEFIEQKNSAER